MTRLAAIVLTALTGFTGLVYEVTWQKYLATLLGSHAEATAAVLAIFLGGLSVGYAWFGELTRRRVERSRASGDSVKLLGLYAWIEAGIGGYAVLFPTLFSAVQGLSLRVPVANASLAFGFDLSLCLLLIGPPAVLMGGTIPIMTLALAGDREHATRVHAWIYAANTAGACVGALAAAFVLIPRLGLDGVLYAMGAINVVAGLAFALLGVFGARVEPALAGSGAPTDATVRRFAAYAVVSMLAGFAMMALQTTLNRIAALALGSSHFTFAIVVAVFVLCIAIGSLGVSAFRRIPRWVIVGSQWGLVVLLILLYEVVDDAAYWAYALRGVFRQIDSAFYPFQFASAASLFLVLAVPIGLSGALLPLLFHHLRGEIGELGAIAGRLYSWNTLGSLLGALLGGYLLLFWLDLDDIYRISVAALVVEAAILTVVVFRVSAALTAAAVVLPIFAALWFLPSWEPERLVGGLFRSRAPDDVRYDGADVFFENAEGPEIVFHQDGPTSSARESPMSRRYSRTRCCRWES